jgi:2-methylisocitrate lyase-like PEP mutase family enzyme
LHAREGAFIIPNPWDAGSARLLAALGFEALATTSAGFAFSIGRLDGRVTLAENIAHCRALCAATDLPVSADLENCFADDPREAANTILLAAEAGVVGGSIEDYSNDDSKPIYDFELAVERVHAAVEAARSLGFPFTLTARAENLLRGRPDLDDTIRRLQAFAKAGADVLYAPALTTLEQVRTLTGAVSKPVNVLAPALKGVTLALLAEAGAKRISIGGALARAAIAALLRAGSEMRERGTFGWTSDLASGAEVKKLLEPWNR